MATSATRHVLKNENEVIAIGTGNFVARTERSIAGSRFTKEIYGDLAKPGVSQVGKALGTLFGLGNTLLYPIQLLNDRTRIALNNNLERYRSQIENVPEAEIVAVSSEVGVPVLEKLAYVTDDEISQL